MVKTSKKKRVLAGGVCLFLGAFLVSGIAPPIRVNFSDSVAKGFYFASPAGNAKKNGYALVCLSGNAARIAAERAYVRTRGTCGEESVALLKKIVAAGGDSVAFTENGITVNGEVLANSAPLASDGKGRPMPVFRTDAFVLSDDEIVVFGDGDAASSFDSRYFGPLRRNSIASAAEPFFTWGE